MHAEQTDLLTELDPVVTPEAHAEPQVPEVPEAPKGVTPSELKMLHRALQRRQLLEDVKNADAELKFVTDHLAETYGGRKLDPNTGLFE